MCSDYLSSQRARTTQSRSAFKEKEQRKKRGHCAVGCFWLKNLRIWNVFSLLLEFIFIASDYNGEENVCSLQSRKAFCGLKYEKCESCGQEERHLNLKPELFCKAVLNQCVLHLKRGAKLKLQFCSKANILYCYAARCLFGLRLQ